jgi:predicted acetyltransferase
MTHPANITIRSAQADELRAIANLSRLSFAPLSSAEAIETEWYGGGVDLPGHKLLVAIDPANGAAIGSYSQLELGIWLEGRQLEAMGIAAVAVAPHRRGQRIARHLLEHALETAREQHLPLIALYPFQHGFYRRLGWAWVGQTRQYPVATRDLPTFPERHGIVPYDPQTHPDSLKQVYEKAACLHNGWLRRQDWQWQRYLKPSKGKDIYVYTEGDQIFGYVRWNFVEQKSAGGELAIAVQEWVALTAEAYRGIIGFLASLRDQISTIIWNTNPTDPFPHLLREQRRDPTLQPTPFEFGLTKPFGEIGSGFMWRLVDLEHAFNQRPIQPVAPFALTFQVTDPIWGEKSITVDFSEGRMTCLNQPVGAVLKTTIEHLTELYSGVRRGGELLWMGEIEFEGDRTLLNHLDTAWQASPPFCWDFF